MGTTYKTLNGKLVGAEIVLKRLNDKLAEIEGGTRRGMRAAVTLVRRDSAKETPVDTNNLRGSIYAETYVDKEGNVSGEVGYTAAYAVFVHEIPKNYKVGSVGFLRKALVKNSRKIFQIMKESAKIK